MKFDRNFTFFFMATGNHISIPRDHSSTSSMITHWHVKHSPGGFSIILITNSQLCLIAIDASCEECLFEMICAKFNTFLFFVFNSKQCVKPRGTLSNVYRSRNNGFSVIPFHLLLCITNWPERLVCAHLQVSHFHIPAITKCKMCFLMCTY